MYSHKYLPMRAEFYLPRQTEKQQGILVVVAVKNNIVPSTILPGIVSVIAFAVPPTDVAF